MKKEMKSIEDVYEESMAPVKGIFDDVVNITIDGMHTRYPHFDKFIGDLITSAGTINEIVKVTLNNVSLDFTPIQRTKDNLDLYEGYLNPMYEREFYKQIEKQQKNKELDHIVLTNRVKEQSPVWYNDVVDGNAEATARRRAEEKKQILEQLNKNNDNGSSKNNG